MSDDPEVKLSRHEAVSCNILSISVGTNCPMGGDSGHGGKTVLMLRDEAATDMTVSVYSQMVRFDFGGDTECATLIECLRWAADELTRQMLANHKQRQKKLSGGAR